MEIDTANRFVVGGGGRGVSILMPPRGPMTPDEALNLAAYLVVLAQHQASHTFQDVLMAVQNT